MTTSGGEMDGGRGRHVEIVNVGDGKKKDDLASNEQENAKLDEAFQIVIDNFKKLFDAAGEPGSIDQEQIDRNQLFFNLFAKSMERHVNGEPSGGYDELLEEASLWLNTDQFVFRAFRFKRLGSDFFDFFVRFTSDSEELIIQSVATFAFVKDEIGEEQLLPKVVKLDTRRLQQRKKVPGQISASSVWQIWPGLVERDFASKVYPLPREVGNDSFLSSDSGMGQPVIEKHEMIRVFMKNDDIHSSVSGPADRRARHALQGKEKTVVRLVDERNSPYANGAYIKTMKQSRLLAKRPSLVLKLCDSRDETVALCEQENSGLLGKGYFTFMVYSRQEPHRSRTGYYKQAPSMKDEHGNTYYAWFRVQIHRKDPELRYVYVWNPVRNEFDVLFKVIEPPPSKQPARASVAVRNSKHEEPQRMSTTFMPMSLHSASSASSSSKSLGLQLYEGSVGSKTAMATDEERFKNLYCVFSRCTETTKPKY